MYEDVIVYDYKEEADIRAQRCFLCAKYTTNFIKACRRNFSLILVTNLDKRVKMSQTTLTLLLEKKETHSHHT